MYRAIKHNWIRQAMREVAEANPEVPAAFWESLIPTLNETRDHIDFNYVEPRIEVDDQYHYDAAKAYIESRLQHYQQEVKGSSPTE